MLKSTGLVLLAYFAAGGGGLRAAGPLDGADRDGGSGLYIVARKTGLMKSTDGGKVLVATLSPGDLLRTLPTSGSGAGNERWVIVIDRRSAGTVGWVDIRECYHFHMGPSDRADLPKDTTAIADAPAVLPALIRRRSAHLQQTYREVDALIGRNEAAGKSKLRLPEPYFVRARVWGIAENYDASARDYLTGASLVKANRLDAARYAIYYDELNKTLVALERMPKPIDTDAAADHYEQGRQAFWAGQYKRALGYLDDAVGMNSSEPLYWYYRGLTHKQMGEEARAVHDARLGAHLEGIDRKRGRDTRYILDAFERVQGPTRVWLTKIRKGDRESR